MRSFSIILVLSILGVWIYVVICKLRSGKGQSGWRKLLIAMAAVLVSAGALGFFGSALSSMGGLNWLPDSFEWPVGVAKGVVLINDNFFVVPHTPSGRIQVYDRNWKFLRGWHVDAGGGEFKLVTSNSNRVEVFTARGNRHYVFDLGGKSISEERVQLGSYRSLPASGKSYIVPTTILLWVFSDPFYSWFSALAGVGMFVAVERSPRRNPVNTIKNSFL